MAWIRNNKFIAGFIAVMIIGVGGLGYLLYDSLGHYQQVAQEYDTQVRELKRLQAKDPFPNQEHLTEYEKNKNDYRQTVDDLQNALASLEPPPETPVLTPTQFQDRLRKSVDDVTKAAQSVGTALPEDFYMGFERYRSSLPDPGATAALTSQLNNVETLVGLLIKERVEKLANPKRAILPQETPGSSDAQRAKPGAATSPASELISKTPVVLVFSGPPSSFRASLNDIVMSKRLFVIRALTVSDPPPLDKGPVRGQEIAPPGGYNAAPAPAAEAAGSPGEPLPPKEAPPLRYVVGQERLDVVMRVELTRVAARR